MAPLFSSRFAPCALHPAGLPQGRRPALSILTLPVRTFFAFASSHDRDWVRHGGDFLRATAEEQRRCQGEKGVARVVGAIRSAFDFVPRACSLTYSTRSETLSPCPALAIFPCLLVGWCPIHTITTGSALRSLSVQYCDGVRQP